MKRSLDNVGAAQQSRWPCRIWKRRRVSPRHTLSVHVRPLQTGSSLTGALVAAQNQAAIGAACMLNILDDLEHQCTIPTSPTSSAAPRLWFPITTEGPVHELWVHFRLEETTHMQNIRTWRTTHRRDVREFSNCLAHIFKWEITDFLKEIQDMLDGV